MAKKAEKRIITLDNGEQAEASFPVIVSASRSTDIPAFYADWFFSRLKKGYSAWKNPFNGKTYYIGYEDAKFIVFWSKNPRPLLAYLDCLKERGIGCYINYSLNDYEKDGLEKNVRPLQERIETFRELVKKLGKGSVIWRFDPLVLTDRIDIPELVARIKNIGAQLHDHTEKLVFSFVDIFNYKKVKANLDKAKIAYRDWTRDDMREFAERLVELNRREGWNLRLATCGELADLEGIEHNRCVDDRLILRLCPNSPELLRFLNAEVADVKPLLEAVPPGAIEIGSGQYITINKNNRDTGQRDACLCAKSKDIGEYNTCNHQCAYCYANTSKEVAASNYARHLKNPDRDTITGS